MEFPILCDESITCNPTTQSLFSLTSNTIRNSVSQCICFEGGIQQSLHACTARRVASSMSRTPLPPLLFVHHLRTFICAISHKQSSLPTSADKLLASTLCEVSSDPMGRRWKKGLDNMEFLLAKARTSPVNSQDRHRSELELMAGLGLVYTSLVGSADTL